MADASGGHVAEGRKVCAGRHAPDSPQAKAPESSGARIRLSGGRGGRSGGLLVGVVLGELSKKLVGLLLLREGLLEKLGGIAHAELRRPGLEGAVAADLVVLDGLGSVDQAGIESLAVGEFFHDLLAFLDD